VAVACTVAGTLLSGQTPANSSSVWVRDAQGCTVEAGMAFIAVGADVGAGLARCGAARMGGAPRACSGALGHIEHVAVFIYLSSCASRSPKHANLTKCLVQDIFLAPRAS
jgi:hypothetical protein